MVTARFEGGGGTVMVEGRGGRRTYLTIEEAQAIADLLAPGAGATRDAQRHLDLHRDTANGWSFERPNGTVGVQG